MTSTCPPSILVDPDLSAVALIVVNYGSHEHLVNNLTRVVVGRDCGRVVVVDNRTTDDERRAVSRLADQHGWEVVLQDDNPGFGAGCNRGVDRAKELGCTAFVLLNPDARVSAQTLRALATDAARDPLSLTTPRLVRPDGTDWFTGGQIDLRTGRTRTLNEFHGKTEPWLTAACLMVHRTMWDLVGGFDERFFLYWEDLDFSHRCRLAGAQLRVRGDLVAVHDVGGTQGVGKSSVYYLQNCRNRLLFGAKHAHHEDLWRWVWHTPGYAAAVVLRGGRRQLLRSWSPIIAAGRGSWQGLRLVASSRRRRRSR